MIGSNNQSNFGQDCMQSGSPFYMNRYAFVGMRNQLKSFLFLIFCFQANMSISAFNPILSNVQLRVLDIGNSYTNNATDLLPLIAKASKADLNTMCLYRCYRSGGSFRNWVDIYNDNDNGNNACHGYKSYRFVYL